MGAHGLKRQPKEGSMKSMKITIGKLMDGTLLQFDLQILLESRLLIQGSSGSGKSMTVRTLLEVTYAMVQQIVLDLDGDYATLREKYDYIIVGKDGDIPADPRTAGTLARLVMEHHLSIIVDLTGLSHADKHEFVRAFGQGMLDLPKELWHPCLFLLDEAHKFCPENGEGTSVAKAVVIELCDNGRKRGIGAVLATQRLAKLDKSAAAECGNKLIGMTFYDDDRKRAARELGLQGQAAIHALGQINPGVFYALGRALSRELVMGTIDKAKSRHPRAGEARTFKLPKPTPGVKGMLAKLKDLPMLAAKEAQDLAGMRAQVADLKRQLQAVAKPAAPAPAPGATFAQIEKAKTDTRREMRGLAVALVKNLLSGAVEKAQALGVELEVAPAKAEVFKASEKFTAPSKAEPKVITHVYTGGGGPAFSICERKILGFLATRPGTAFTKTQVGAMTGYAPTGGGFLNSLSKLRTAGLVQGQGDQLSLAPGADLGSVVAGVPHSLQDWIQKLSKCESAIYQQLLTQAPGALDKEGLAAATGYQAGGGGFLNSISRLCTLGLIKRQPNGELAINAELQQFL